MGRNWDLMLDIFFCFKSTPPPLAYEMVDADSLVDKHEVEIIDYFSVYSLYLIYIFHFYLFP